MWLFRRGPYHGIYCKLTVPRLPQNVFCRAVCILCHFEDAEQTKAFPCTRVCAEESP